MASFFKKLFFIKEKKPLRLGLALGGGGFRGYSHIGVIRAFEEAGLKFDIVTGTSVGSMIGALYALGASAADIRTAAEDIEVKMLHSKIPVLSADPARIGQILINRVGNLKFSDCNVKFAAVAVDLALAREIVLDEGYLADAVSASCAVPFVFKPYKLNGRNLVDGGLLNNIPADVARMLGAEIVVAVDINSARGRGTESTKTLDVLTASFRIMSAASGTRSLVYADAVIAPDTEKFSASKKQGWEEMIDAGYAAAKEKIPEILDLIENKRKGSK